jgi:endonuclease YncB( thermonuclease family)
MFGWRRRSEGFEWQEYVRTTILVRRADRQRKVDDVRMAAIEKVKDTRDKGVAAASAAAKSVWRQLLDITLALLNAAWLAICGFAVTSWSILCALAAIVVERLPAIKWPAVSWPAISLPAFPRPDWLRLKAAQEGAKRAAKLLPDVGFRLRFDKRMLGGAAIALAMIYIGGPMLRSGETIGTASLVPTVSAPDQPASPGALSGRATAISGDLLRIDGQLIRLAGIEAPEANQPCVKANGRRWNCGASARSALEKIVRGKSVNCTKSGQDEGGQVIASCRINDADVAETLVRGGHVFAESGLLASYTSAESEAKSAAIGLWQGETIRPNEWRDQVWEVAKKAAPEGCPIKGYVRASNRFYALPWSHGYDGAKVRTVKGDRWFCSEEEARSAGFKLSSRS